MYRHAAGSTSSSFFTSSSGLSRSCICTFRSRKFMTSPSACANTNLPPRATTGTLRAPSLRSSSIPAGLPCTLIDSYSTPLLVRNSLVLKQLVHPGCQKTLTFSAASMQEPSNRTRGIDLRPAVNNRITRIFRQIHGDDGARVNGSRLVSGPCIACIRRRRGSGHRSRQQLPERQGAAPARRCCKGHLRETRPRPAAFLYRELREAARRACRRRVRHRAFRGGQRRRHGMHDVDLAGGKPFALLRGVLGKGKLQGEAASREDALCNTGVQGQRLGVREAVDANGGRIRGGGG